MMPTDTLAPNNSAMISTLTIAKPGKPVLEKPRENAPNRAISQVAVEMSSKKNKRSASANSEIHLHTSP